MKFVDQEEGVAVQQEKVRKYSQKSARRIQIELTALGTDFRGLPVSAATRPQFSEPDIAKIHVGMIDKKPLKPFVNPPVEFQYRNPIGPPTGAPPAEITIMVIITTKIQPNLMLAKTTSTSANQLTATTLIATMTRKKMVIHAAVGTESVQKPSTVTNPASSFAIVIQYWNQ